MQPNLKDNLPEFPEWLNLKRRAEVWLPLQVELETVMGIISVGLRLFCWPVYVDEIKTKQNKNKTKGLFIKCKKSILMQ